MENRRNRILLIVALASFALFIADRIVFSRMAQLYKDRSEEIVELGMNLDKGQSLLDRRDTLQERWREMRKRSLPVDESAAENMVLQSAARWSRESGLGVSSLKPRWIEGNEEYKRLECTAQAQGRLEAVARFLNEIERDPLGIKIEQIEATAQDDAGGQIALTVRFTGLILTEGVAQ